MISRSLKQKKTGTRTAFIHIGTEKTGTSSIQKFMLDNQKELMRNGLLYPIDCGFLSNFKLIWYATKNVDSHPLKSPQDISDPVTRSRWVNTFEQKHQRVVSKFQSANPAGSVVAYSSEHLQSRLVNQAELEKLKAFLSPMYDKMKIVVYLRRQDKLAVSAYSTLLRAGHTQPFKLPPANRLSHYFSYARLIGLWSDVFGKENMEIKIYERSQMLNGDIVDDFGELVGYDANGSDYKRISASNTSLAYTAQVALFRLNNIIARNKRDADPCWEKLRAIFVTHIENISDEYSKDLLNRESAIQFYDIFKDDNDAIVNEYGLGSGFNEDFSKYPEVLPKNLDDSARDEIARSIIAEFLESHADRIHHHHKICLSNEISSLQVAS